MFQGLIYKVTGNSKVRILERNIIMKEKNSYSNKEQVKNEYQFNLLLEFLQIK